MSTPLPLARLNEIADSIEPLEAAYFAAWKLDSTANMEKALTAAASALNAAIEPFVDEVARVTNNSASTIRQVYCPKLEYQVWFGLDASPAQFLRNVARHSSFNTDFWAANERRLDELQLKQAYLAGPQDTDVVGPKDAAAAVLAGHIPRVDERHLADFRVELGRAGVLRLYNGAQDRDSFSATRPFAFIAATRRVPLLAARPGAQPHHVDSAHGADDDRPHRSTC